jgi:hypothetical protein
MTRIPLLARNFANYLPERSRLSYTFMALPKKSIVGGVSDADFACNRKMLCSDDT